MLLAEDEIMKCFVQVCLALQAVHAQGIIHRDIKTSNIFLSAANSLDSSSIIVKFGDFGIAKALAPGQLRRDNGRYAVLFLTRVDR